MTPPMERACKRSRETLDAVADGHDQFAAREALEQHAATCEVCRVALARAVAMRTLLDGLNEPEATRIGEDAFVDAVMERLTGSAGASPIVSPGVTAGGMAVDPIVAAPARKHSTLRLVVLAATAAAAVFAAVRLSRTTGESNSGSASPAQPGVHGIAEANVAQVETVAPGEPEVVIPSVEIEVLPELDMASFRSALNGAANAVSFSPEDPASAAPLLAAITERFDGDLQRATRRILRAAAPGDRLGLAARLLGLRADARDRALLVKSIETCGAAGAWALVDLGRTGVNDLWAFSTSNRGAEEDAAADQTSPVAIARRVLGDAAKLGKLDGHFPRSLDRDPAFAAALTSVSTGGSAKRLLDGFLASGASPWLDVWSAHADSEAALSDLIEAYASMRWSVARRTRLVRAIGTARMESGLDVTVEALHDGIPEAAPALSRLPGSGAARALFAASGYGLLDDDIDDAAWSAMIEVDCDRVLAVAFDSDRTLDQRSDVLLSAIIRSRDEKLTTNVQTILLGLADRTDLPTRLRASALLLLAERGPRLAPGVAGGKEALALLCTDPEATVASAARLAWTTFGGDVGELPVAVRRMVESSATLAVRHSRLARIIRRERNNGASW